MTVAKMLNTTLGAKAFLQFLPFVRVEVEGVGQLNTIQKRSILVKDERASGVCRIDVEPDVLIKGKK